MIKSFSVVSALALCGASLCACAEEPAGPPPAVTEALARVIPDEKPDEVRRAPIPGFQEVSYGAQVFYISDDGRYVLQGEVLDLTAQENLTEVRRTALRANLLQSLDPKDTIAFAPAEGVRHVVYVFTDVDCTYCRHLHAEIEEYNALGIEVRYLAFPRAGADSPIYDKMVSVWCAKDRRAALTLAKAGRPVAAANCPNPVRDQLALAASFGVSGTPTLVFADGSSLTGYVPPARLAAYLDGQAAGP